MGSKSLLLLGWNFFLHLLRRATFTYRRGGAKQFRANFDPEHLLPVTPNDREMLPAWQSCIACGLCDKVCPDLLSIVQEGRGVAPQLIASGLHRDLTAYNLVFPDASYLASCNECSDCEDICPVDIPLQSLAEFIVRAGDLP